MMAGKGRGQVEPNFGQEAFVLYDTYGFPVELTREIASEKGFSVDMEVFEQEMERQRKRAREASRFANGETQATDYSGVNLPATVFVGYEATSAEGRVLSLSTDGKSVSKAEEGQKVEIVLDRTPFYAEMGGQVGDKGSLAVSSGSAEVEDTAWVRGDLVGHRGRVIRGIISVGESVKAEVDAERRADIARNHTATHLLQAALRRVLGTHVQQRGSLVVPERFRFDFSHPKAMTREELSQVQNRVNHTIRENLKVTSRVMPHSQAIAEGAIALFGEKYGDTVRLVQVTGANCSNPAVVFSPRPVSAELCGGTHVSATGDIGLFLITAETSVGAGLRRVEGVTGRAAERLVASYFDALQGLSERLKTAPEEVPQKVDDLLEDIDAGRKRVAQLERELSWHGADSLASRAETVGGIAVLATRVNVSTINGLRDTGDALRDKLKSAVIALGAIIDDRPQFLVMVTPDLVSKGLHAGEIAKKVAQVAGGGGGGRPEMAQAGGKDKTKLDEASQMRV